MTTGDVGVAHPGHVGQELGTGAGEPLAYIQWVESQERAVPDRDKKASGKGSARQRWASVKGSLRQRWAFIDIVESQEKVVPDRDELQERAVSDRNELLLT